MTQDSGDTALLFDNQICFPLYSAANAMVRVYRPLLKELDVTYLQYMVLMLLWEKSALNVKELGQQMRLDSGTLTPLLKRLEQKGLVTRSRSKTDERVRVIAITKEGMALKKKAKDIPEKLACKVGLSKPRVKEFNSMCLELLAFLDD
ncbi:MAG: MarR family transcriptional regulator [Oceanicoccus sp.]